MFVAFAIQLCCIVDTLFVYSYDNNLRPRMAMEETFNTRHLRPADHGRGLRMMNSVPHAREPRLDLPHLDSCLKQEAGEAIDPHRGLAQSLSQSLTRNRKKQVPVHDLAAEHASSVPSELPCTALL